MKIATKRIKELFTEDQHDRRDKTWLKLSIKNRWSKINPRDMRRQKELDNILKQRPKLRGIDYFRAGIIFQHSTSSQGIKRAQQLASLGIKKGHKKSKWLYAAATDRLLVMKHKPQRFGTQFGKNKKGQWELLLIDTSTTDSQRKLYGVRSLQGLKKVVLSLNRPNANVKHKTSVSSR